MAGRSSSRGSSDSDDRFTRATHTRGGAAPNPNGDGRALREPQPRGHRDNRSDVRYATTSQLRAIRAICNHQGLDARQVTNERFRANNLEELTLREASSLIDKLKTTRNHDRSAGGS
jgi:hypothetical protein